MTWVLDPMFDPLRNDPRFQKLTASLAPKAADAGIAQFTKSLKRFRVP
jgi:hypothetical protein